MRVPISRGTLTFGTILLARWPPLRALGTAAATPQCASCELRPPVRGAHHAVDRRRRALATTVAGAPGGFRSHSFSTSGVGPTQLVGSDDERTGARCGDYRGGGNRAHQGRVGRSAVALGARCLGSSPVRGSSVQPGRSCCGEQDDSDWAGDHEPVGLYAGAERERGCPVARRI